VIYTDVALDPYNSDGHDGIVREDGQCSVATPSILPSTSFLPLPGPRCCPSGQQQRMALMALKATSSTEDVTDVLTYLCLSSPLAACGTRAVPVVAWQV